MASSAVKSEAKEDKFLVLPILVLILAQMGTSGDNGALSLAATALTQDLGATVADIQLANMVYSLMAGAFMIAGGLMGTIIGWKKNFRIGAALCSIGEVVLAFAPNMTIFIWGGRILVGFGASFMIPSVLGLVPKMYFGKNRVLAFGCIGAASGLSALLPLVLGVVMELAGMKATFLTLAVYFAMVLLLSFKLPAIEQNDGKLKFDGIGVVLAALGLFLFLVGISRISAWGLVQSFPGAPSIGGYSPVIPMVIAGIIILAVLVVVEKKVEAKNGLALLPQSFLKTPQVLAGLAASAITFFFMGVQAILMSPYLQLVAGWSAISVGVTSIVTGAPTFAFSMGIPKVAPNANPRRVIQIGYIVMAAALGVMALAVTVTGVNNAMIYLGAFLAGSGAGIVSSQANNVVALAVNERDAAQSGGIQTTMRNVGQALGIALLGAVLLFGITNSVKAEAASSPVISAEVNEQLADMNFSLVSDENFEAQIAGIDMTDAERTELVKINQNCRYDSTRFAYGVGAVIILAGLLTTPAIKIFKKEEA
ncbi:MFS transporter [Collinsella provencensis]|uniref:MFS transporter n=1 Tax=Collinsella provencensis TaxID=1937461 RepID=UPI000C831FB8|nr:MFS transporter [Collinsella provencensis]